MSKTTKILLNKERSVDSVNENTKIEFNIDNTNRLIPLNDIDTTINVYEQYLKEREASTIYRFYGMVNGVPSNPLYNDNVSITGNSSGGNITAKKVRSSAIFQKDGWLGYFNDEPNEELELVGDNKSSLCDFIPFDPGYNRLNFLDADGKPNYLLKITYPYSARTIQLGTDSNYTLKDGIPIIEKIRISLNGREYVGFRTPINHGLKERDSIQLNNFVDLTPGNELGLNTDRLFNVFKVGNEINDDKFRVFVLDIDPTEINFYHGASTIKRVVNNYESAYYVRVFKSLTTADLAPSGRYKDYDIYPGAYGETYFNDRVAAFNFIKDIDVNGLRDNLGRPISELYLTIVKNDNDSDPASINSQYWASQQYNLGLSTDFWTPISAGYLMENDPNINYNVRAIKDPDYNGRTWFNNIDETDILFDGDIVEYNGYELLERSLETLYHRINTVYRENGNASISLTTSSSNLLVSGQFNLEDSTNPGMNYDYFFGIALNPAVSYLSVGQTVGLCYYDQCGKRNMCNLFEIIDIGSRHGNQIISFNDPSNKIIHTNGSSCVDEVKDGEGRWVSGDAITISFNGCPCTEGSTTTTTTTSLEEKNEGYIYKPHNKIPIREFASVINPIVDLQTVFDQYNITTLSEQQKLKKDYRVPDYATQISPNVYRWRDLLEIGEIDAVGSGVDYPFESGAHYLYLNNRFYLERQDPPCNFFLTTEQVLLPTEKDKFIKMLGEPTFFDYDILNRDDLLAQSSSLNVGGVTNLLDYNNGSIPLEVDVRFFTFFGEYELGKRDTAGACVDFSMLKTQDISDEC